FDPAKQMSFAVSKSSQSHAQYPSAPLRKTCARLESLLCRTVWRFGTRLHTESMRRFGTMPRRTAVQSIAPFRRRNCAVAHQQIESGEFHRQQSHLHERIARSAFGDFFVVIRSRDLPVARVPFFADCIEAAHELGGVFRIAEFLELICQR